MTSADVVIIGGGVNGASVAFNLARLGVRRVVLLERRHLGAGASGKSGSLVRMHYTNEAESRLAWESLKVFRNFDAMVGGDCGFEAPGFVQIVDPAHADALRANVAMGDYPDFLYFGGNGDLRGYDYLQFAGQNTVYANAELRFPLIEAMLTPLGVMGGIRGVLFANMGGGHFEGQQSVTATPTSPEGYRWFATGSETYRPIIGYTPISFTQQEPIYGAPRTISGLRLVDARASYGVGLETFALGFPIHIDWSWKTLFNRDWEDALFAAYGGSHEFRKAKVSFWIGYDF